MRMLVNGRLRLLAYAYAAELVLALALTGVFFADRTAGLFVWDIAPGINVLLAGLAAWVNFRLTGRKIWAAAAIFLAYMAFNETFELHRMIGHALLRWESGPVVLINELLPGVLIHRHPQTIPIVAMCVVWLVLIAGLFRHVKNSRLGLITFCLSLMIMVGVIGEYILLATYGRIGPLSFGPAWGIRQVAELFGTFSLALSFMLVAKANKARPGLGCD